MPEYRPLVPKSLMAAVCFKCGARSMDLAFDHGIGVWVTPFDLIRTEDRTSEVVAAFGKHGWLIEYHKATCPECQTNAAQA